MGYAGGTREEPTYHALGDHTECFQVDFDPEVIAYEDVLALVWQSHDPTRPAFKVQYASVVLAADEGQLAAARGSVASLEAARGQEVCTRVEVLTRFWPAEDYHQKYYLRNDRILAAEFRAMFGGDETSFRESTSAARVNAFVAGHGTPELLERDIARLGLGDEGRRALLSIVERRTARIGCSIR